MQVTVGFRWKPKPRSSSSYLQMLIIYFLRIALLFNTSWLDIQKFIPKLIVLPTDSCCFIILHKFIHSLEDYFAINSKIFLSKLFANLVHIDRCFLLAQLKQLFLQLNRFLISLAEFTDNVLSTRLFINFNFPNQPFDNLIEFILASNSIIDNQLPHDRLQMLQAIANITDIEDHITFYFALLIAALLHYPREIYFAGFVLFDCIEFVLLYDFVDVGS